MEMHQMMARESMHEILKSHCYLIVATYARSEMLRTIERPSCIQTAKSNGVRWTNRMSSMTIRVIPKNLTVTPSLLFRDESPALPRDFISPSDGVSQSFNPHSHTKYLP
jgi:hypothetical protein